MLIEARNLPDEFINLPITNRKIEKIIYFWPKKEGFNLISAYLNNNYGITVVAGI